MTVRKARLSSQLLKLAPLRARNPRIGQPSGKECEIVPTLVIRNGQVFTRGALFRADVVVEDSKIGRVVPSGEALAADRVIDAEGLLVLPGFIDTHSHFREPGYEYKEDHETGSRAAAAGGITMYVTMPNLEPPPNTVERVRAQKELAKTKSYVDFNLWASPTRLEEIPKIAREGVPGFKFFGKSAHYPYSGDISIFDQGQMLETMRAIAKTGLWCVVHPHNQMIWESHVKERVEKGWTTPDAWHDATYADDDIMNGTALVNVVLIAEAVGCKLRTLHISGRPSVRRVRMLKSNGYDFVAEMNPWAVMPLPPVSPTDPADIDANWRALNDGTVDVIGSDHAPHTREEHEKASTNTFDSVILAMPVIEHVVSLFLTGVNQGKLPLDRFIRLYSENVARHLGVFPRKGIIQEGSDADITIVDMKKQAVLGESYPVYSKVGFTPLHGYQVQGVPVYTIVRGQVIMDHGEIVGKPGYGEFVSPLDFVASE